MDMKNSVKGVAKRLLFSLAVLGGLGGCAVYDSGYSYPYYGTSYYSDPVYPAAPVYGYGPAPLYTAPPVYVPPPVFRFDYRSGGGHRWHDGGHRRRDGGAHHWRNGGGGHHWRDGGHRPHVQPGMRGDGRWRAPGEGHGRR
jgi:hypothetical protein